MARYIDADALMKKLNEDPIGQTIVQRYNIDGFIKAFPTADVVEVKHGTWIHDGYYFPHGNDWIHCSVCGKKGINVPADLTNFCPNCGAKMDGEETANEKD